MRSFRLSVHIVWSHFDSHSQHRSNWTTRKRNRKTEQVKINSMDVECESESSQVDFLYRETSTRPSTKPLRIKCYYWLFTGHTNNIYGSKTISWMIKYIFSLLWLNVTLLFTLWAAQATSMSFSWGREKLLVNREPFFSSVCSLCRIWARIDEKYCWSHIIQRKLNRKWK